MLDHQNMSSQLATNTVARLAVLIDADNVQPASVEKVVTMLAKNGDTTVKRMYGDFTSPASAQWKTMLHTYAIKPVQQFAYSTGKNATDSMLIIDAMDLLYTRRFDGFCIVSSDSDFTSLALRIREEGLLVLGFGKHSTPEAFRNACHTFYKIDEAAPQPQPHPVQTNQRTQSPVAKILSIVPAQPKSKLPVDVILQALDNASDETGWATLGNFGHHLKQLKPDFAVKSYGFKQLGDLVRARTDLFKIQQRPVPGSTHTTLYVRSSRKK